MSPWQCRPDGYGVPSYRRLQQCPAGGRIVTLRFNFRGVQGSKGERSGGLYEMLDVCGAVRFLLERNEVDSSHVYLVGDSFGAWMVTEALREDEPVAGIVCIVLPLAHMEPLPEHLWHDRRPKLFIAAENDPFCDLHVFRDLYRHWAPPKDLMVLEGSDHFLGIGPSVDPVNRAPEIAEAVASWLYRVSATTS